MDYLNTKDPLLALSDNYQGPYVAWENPRMNFDGNESPAKDLQFKVNIANTTGLAKTVAIFPAYFDCKKVDVSVLSNIAVGSSGNFDLLPHGTTLPLAHNSITEIVAAGYTVDAVLADGSFLYVDSSHALVGTGSGRTIKTFIDFVKLNPCRVPEVIISANDKEMYSGIMRVVKVSPFKKLPEQEISLENFFDPYQQQDKKIVINEAFQLDNQTLVIITIPAVVTSVDITFRLGAIANEAARLNAVTGAKISAAGAIMPRRK
jgi:hypothetical protein